MSVRDEWRWTDEQGVQRLVRTDELKAAIENAVLPPSTLVWREGMKEWAPASAMPELSASAAKARALSEGKAASLGSAVATPLPAPKREGGATQDADRPPGLRKRPPMKTLQGVTPPTSDMPGPLSSGDPIVVPSVSSTASGAKGRAVTQPPRFTPPPAGSGEDLGPTIDIPRAPKLPGATPTQARVGNRTPGSVVRATSDIPSPPRKRARTSEIDQLWSVSEEPDTLTHRSDRPPRPGGPPRPQSKPPPPLPARALAGRTPSGHPPPVPQRDPANRDPANRDPATPDASKALPLPTKRRLAPGIPPRRTTGKWPNPVLRSASASPQQKPSKPPPPKPRQPSRPPQPSRPEKTADPIASDTGLATADLLNESTAEGSSLDIDTKTAVMAEPAHKPHAEPSRPDDEASGVAAVDDKTTDDTDDVPTRKADAKPTAKAESQTVAHAAAGAKPEAAKKPDPSGDAPPKADAKGALGTTDTTEVKPEAQPKGKIDLNKTQPLGPTLRAAKAESATKPLAKAAAADVQREPPRSDADELRPPPLTDAAISPATVAAIRSDPPADAAGRIPSVPPPRPPRPSDAPAGITGAFRPLAEPVSVPLSSLIVTGGVWVACLVTAFIVGRSTASDIERVAETGVARAFAVHEASEAAAPTASTGEAKPCWVTRQAVRWAPLASKNVAFEMRATPAGTLELGFAVDSSNAKGLEVDPKSGRATELFSQEESEDRSIVRVTPLGRSSGGFVVTTRPADEDDVEEPSAMVIPVAGEPPFFVNVLPSALSWAPALDAQPTELWKLPGDHAVSAMIVHPANDHVALSFRRDESVWGGWLDKERKPMGELTEIKGSGGSVGRPKSGFNGEQLAVVFADQPEGGRWEIRAARAPAGSVPTQAEVIGLPEGGPGGDAFAPDIVGLPDGRWLLMWTEGPEAGKRAVRAQTLASDFSPIGDPIALSPPAGSFGQAQLGVVGTYTTAVFLALGESGFELWGAVLQCG